MITRTFYVSIVSCCHVAAICRPSGFGGVEEADELFGVYTTRNDRNFYPDQFSGGHTLVHLNA